MVNRLDSDQPCRGYRSRREKFTMSIGSTLFCVTTMFVLGHNLPLAYVVVAAGFVPVVIWIRWGRKAFPLKPPKTPTE